LKTHSQQQQQQQMAQQQAASSGGWRFARACQLARTSDKWGQTSSELQLQLLYPATTFTSLCWWVVLSSATQLWHAASISLLLQPATASDDMQRAADVGWIVSKRCIVVCKGLPAGKDSKWVCSDIQ
jgi:hypothetical protein